MNKPRVSVIMPTYNRSAFLSRAINSVMMQTYKNWELIIVDDCSPDETEKEVKNYLKPEKISYIRHNVNKGVSAARNTGIRAVKGSELIAYIDDDDEWLPEKLELQVDLLLSDDSLVGIGCGRLYFDGENEEVSLPKYRGYIYEDLFARRASGYGAQNLLLRQKFTKDIYFDENLVCVEDNEYVMRVSREGKMDFVNKPLVRLYIEKDREHVWNSQNVIKGYMQLIEKYADELRDRKNILAYYNLCIAREYLVLKDARQARKILKNAMHAKPASMRLYGWYVASFFGMFGFKVCMKLGLFSPPK